MLETLRADFEAADDGEKIATDCAATNYAI